MMYQGWKAQSSGRAEPNDVKRVTLRASAKASKPKHGWLDSMLGSGSSRAVESAFARPERPRSVAAPLRSTLRVQAVRSNDAPVAGKPKGVIRLAAVVFVGAWVLGQTKPWQHLALPSIFMRGPEQRHATAEPPATPAPDAAAGPAAPAAIEEPVPQGPLVDAKGQGVALWRAQDGQWYLVNAAGQLRKADDTEASARIDLPQLVGLAAKYMQAGSLHPERLLVLDMKEGLLSQILPLSPEIAPEVQSLDLRDGEVSLQTQSGVTVRLGEDDFKEKEDRLAAVLSDLAARKKRASSVDLRFKDSAVVRLASI